jgi:hypothetical protein
MAMTVNQPGAENAFYRFDVFARFAQWHDGFDAPRGIGYQYFILSPELIPVEQFIRPELSVCHIL